MLYLEEKKGLQVLVVDISYNVFTDGEMGGLSPWFLMREDTTC